MYQYAAEPLLPWSDTENDQRFNAIAKKVFIAFFILVLVIPFLPTPEIEKNKFDEVPTRFTRLLIKQPIKPIIKKPEPKKVEKKKKDVKKKPKKKPKKKVPKKKKVKPKPSAKKVAQSAFDSAGFDELADLRDDFNVSSLKNSKLKVAKKRNVKFDTSSVLKSNNASSGSGGITSSKPIVSGSTKLKSRSTTNVQSSIATTGNKSQRTRTTGWSDEEIQLIFQRNKGAINSIYNRALRKDPGLQGTILLKITLNASGTVIRIVIVSSELRNKSLEKRIRLRVKRFNFGAKPGASNFTFNFPLVLLPQ
jgi:outer membrane biosynthesis protein TonB